MQKVLVMKNKDALHSFKSKRRLFCEDGGYRQEAFQQTFIEGDGGTADEGVILCDEE